MSDYPKILYRAGTGIGHMLADKPLKVENKYLCDVMTVETEDAELAALEDGWNASPAAACEPKPEAVKPDEPKPAPKTTEKAS